MNYLFSLLKKHDWVISFCVFALIVIGTLGIYGATYNSSTIDQGQGIISKHLLLVVISIAIYFAFHAIDFRWLKESNIIWIIYFVIIILLIYVKLFTSEISGTNRWIMIGGFSIQPAEYAKIVMILITAYMLSGGRATEGIYKINLKNNSGILSNDLKSSMPVLFIILKSALLITPILFLILIQPALGNTIITFLIWLCIVAVFFPNKNKLFAIGLSLTIGFLIGLDVINHFNWVLIPKILISSIGIWILTNSLEVKIKDITVFFLMGILIFPIGNFAWNNILKDYQKTRIEIFLNPEADPQGAGWQVRQSQIAIGSGRFFGKGFMEGTQSALKILPFAHTDFIFASIAEQFGFVGGFVTLALLFTLVGRIWMQALQFPDLFAKYSTFGIGAMVLIQIIINVGMNLGKMPVTGITLPLVSYGGSSVLVTLIGLAIVQNFIVAQNTQK